MYWVEITDYLKKIFNFLKWKIILVSLILFLGFILWIIPKWQIPSTCLSPKQCFEIENEARKTIAQILGGIIVIIGLYFAWKRIDIAQQGQITERFTRAIEQLGNEKIEIRLGGIYALERISVDSERDFQPIMEVLTAYIRERCSISREPTSLTKDIQAVITVIGRRNETFATKYGFLNLKNTYLKGADFSEANLNGIEFDGAQLDDADFALADLNEIFFKQASLKRSKFIAVYFKNVEFEEALLDGADFHGSTFNNSILRRSNLEGASLINTRFEKSSLVGANLTEADFKGANLREALGLSKKQIESAIIDEHTKLPENLK